MDWTKSVNWQPASPPGIIYVPHDAASVNAIVPLTMKNTSQQMLTYRTRLSDYAVGRIGRSNFVGFLPVAAAGHDPVGTDTHFHIFSDDIEKDQCFVTVYIRDSALETIQDLDNDWNQVQNWNIVPHRIFHFRRLPPPQQMFQGSNLPLPAVGVNPRGYLHSLLEQMLGPDYLSIMAGIFGGLAAMFALFFIRWLIEQYQNEEDINGRKLTEIINTEHENAKYLAGFKLPPNVVAESDLVKAAQDADILGFVVPYQFIGGNLDQLAGKIKSTAIGIKGVEDAPGGSIELISDEIQEGLKICVAVLIGANLANEVAAEKFCEWTIGCKDPEKAAKFKLLFQTDNIRIHTVPDAHTVELCSALKNIVACAAGFVDGLQLGDNTKAAVIRLGLIEMQKFIKSTFPNGSKLSAFFESYGIADLNFTYLERELLGGEQWHGPPTAAQVNKMLKAKNLEQKYPLVTSAHNICIQVWKPTDLIDQLRMAHV